MTSVSPPTYYFDGITFNTAFYTTSSSGGLTEAQANALYLKKNTADTATALETFTGTIATNGIQSTTTSTDMVIGSSQTAGDLKLGTGDATRTGRINIGSTSITGQINIETANTNNNVATGLAAISIGTSGVTKFIKIGSSTVAGLVGLGDCQVITSINQNTVFINTISNTTRGISIGNVQTTGALNLGTGGTGPSARQVGGDINIATQASNLCAVNVMNGNTTSGSVNIATGTGATQTTTVNIGSGTTTGTVTIGGASNTVQVNGALTMGSTRNITLKTDGVVPTSGTQLGGRYSAVLFTGTVTTGTIYGTIAIETAGVYLFNFNINQAIAILGSTNYVRLFGTGIPVSIDFGYTPLVSSGSIRIGFCGSQVVVATVSSYTLVLTTNSGVSAAPTGFFTATRIG